MRVVSFPSLHVLPPLAKRKIGVGVQRSAVHQRSNVPAPPFDGLAAFEDHGRDPTRSRQFRAQKRPAGPAPTITPRDFAEEESLVIRVCRVDSSIDEQSGGIDVDIKDVKVLVAGTHRPFYSLLIGTSVHRSTNEADLVG